MESSHTDWYQANKYISVDMQDRMLIGNSYFLVFLFNLIFQKSKILGRNEFLKTKESFPFFILKLVYFMIQFKRQNFYNSKITLISKDIENLS